MGRGKVILTTSCIITLCLFCIMNYLITTVNPKPYYYHIEDDHKKSDKILNRNLPAIAQYGLEKTPDTLIIEYTPYRPALTNTTKNYNSFLKFSPRRVVPPIWSVTSPRPSTVINETDLYQLLWNKKEEVNPKTTASTMNDTLSLIHVKRSLKDFKKHGGDLNSIVLKIMDESGEFNIEIKIGSNDALRMKKIEISENRSQSQNKSKYTMSLKARNSEQFERSQLAKNTIINVMPNDSVTVYEYDDDDLGAESNVKNNTIQVNKNAILAKRNIGENIVNAFNRTKHNITGNESTMMPIFNIYNIDTINVSTPEVIFYNYTKSAKQSYIKTNNLDKKVLIKTANNASDGYKTKLNSLNTAINTANNLTMQTEKSTSPSVRSKHSTIEIENSIISIKSLIVQHETSTAVQKVNSTIPLKTSSIQNDNFIDTKKLVQSQNRTIKNI